MSLAALESVAELALRMAIRDGEMKVADEILKRRLKHLIAGNPKNGIVQQLNA